MKPLPRFIFSIKHVVVTLTAMLLMWLCVQGFLLSISFLNPVERAFDNFRMTDLFYEIESRNKSGHTNDVITLVDMSREFSRSRLGDIISQIDAMNPALLGVDIVFDGIRDDQVGHHHLLDCIREATIPIVWAYQLENWNNERQEFDSIYHSFFADSLDIMEGYTNVSRNMVRSFGLWRKAKGQVEYSLPARMAMQFTGDSSFLQHEDCNIRFSSTQFHVVPCDSLDDYSDLITGHIVLLGATKDKRDVHYTPIGLIPGPHIQAYALLTIINNEFPREVPGGLTLLLTFLFMWVGEILQVGATAFMSARRRWFPQMLGQQDLVAGLVAGGYIVVLVAIDYYLFVRTGYFFNSGWAVMGIALQDTARKWYPIMLESPGKIRNLISKQPLP